MYKRAVSAAVLILCAGLAFADARSAAWRATEELVETYLKGAPATGFKRAAAVLPVEAGNGLERSGAADAVAAYIREKLSMSTVFMLVERANMEAILSEIELGLSGLADPDSVAKAGELIGAEYLVQGSLAEAGERVVLSIELVDVSTGAVLASVTGDMAREDLVREADAYLRSTFQSQYGLSVLGGGGSLYSLEPAMVPNEDYSGVVPGNPFMGLFALDASYKLLPFLSVFAGVISLDSQQFYLSDDGRVQSPLPTATERSIRYSMFHGLGAELGAGLDLSPTPRLNLGLDASFFSLLDHGLTHWFMDFKCYEIDDTGGVAEMNRDIEVEGSYSGPVFGGRAALRAEYLVSRRLSIGLDLGYLFMADYRPEVFQVGSYMQTSNQDEPGLPYIDKNGIWAFMGNFNVARVDGTTGSPYVSYNPSGLYATFTVAIHF